MEGPIRNLPPDSPARGSSSMPDCSSTPVDPRWTVETTSSGARAEDHACQGEDVDADVEQGPAPEVGVDVGAEAQEDDGEPFDEKMKRLTAELRRQQAEAQKLDAAIADNLTMLGFGSDE